MRGVRTSGIVVALALGTIVTACRKPADTPQDGPTLEVRWAGSTIDSANVTVPSSAEWCDSLKMVEIQGLRGDTGIAIALYPVREFGPGRFPVVLPARADSAPPTAAVAVRWFAETSVRGFQGDSGTVIVEQDRPGIYSGRFELAAHSVTDPAQITIHGSFRGLTVRPGGHECVSKPGHPDSAQGVH